MFSNKCFQFLSACTKHFLSFLEPLNRAARCITNLDQLKVNEIEEIEVFITWIPLFFLMDSRALLYGFKGFIMLERDLGSSSLSHFCSTSLCNFLELGLVN